MLKILGILLLMSVSAAFGFLKANKLRLRQKRLSAIYTFIIETAERIKIGEEMEKIIETLGASAGIHKKGYNIYLSEEGLSALDISLAKEFVSSLGMGNKEYEIKRCENYSLLFKKTLSAAETENKEKASVYRKLGIFTGVLVGIVLI